MGTQGTQRKTNWYKLSLTELKKKLKADFYKGLSPEEVLLRQKKYGKNVIVERKNGGILKIVTDQFKSPLVFILFIAGIVTLFLHEFLDAIVIFIALSINIAVGMVQEEKASNSFAKLKELQEKFATVIRDGLQVVISADEIVPGDIIILKVGMVISADIRLLDTLELSVNESALTGEWFEVFKNNKKISEELPIAEQANIAWMGTTVVGGEARGVVVSTGSNTKIGEIAKSLGKKIKNKTPLQKSVEQLARYIAIFILFVLVIIFALGIFRGQSFGEMFLISIAIAVAAMPEGLPAAVTVVLAIGMESILKRKGLVRNLLAAETLGSTTVILTDKTGTLTKAKMRVFSIITAISLDNMESDETSLIAKNSADSRDILAMAILTSDAFVEGYDETLSEWIVRGRPVEKAFVLAGIESGIKQDTLLKNNPELDRIPFDSERRFVASMHSVSGKKMNRIYFAGAPEIFIKDSDFVYIHGKKKRLTDKIRNELKGAWKKKASEGMRILGIAYKDTYENSFSEDDKDDDKKILDSVVFGGFILIHDPIRADVPSSIKSAKEAGAHIIMLTGDSEDTAKKVAIDVGIAKVGDISLTGEDMENFTDRELLASLYKTKVFARVLPRQKMRIVQVLKGAGEVVAMTGDGVNDAPALRRANIGIALGSGTDVAKEASDMVLLNNSFTVIVAAIEEGRRILDNLKKIVAYLLSTSFSEILIVGGALAFGAPIPLLPTQILWTNIVEEGFMNFSFAFEPKEGDVMKRNPNEPGMRSILTYDLNVLILILGIVTGVVLVVIYFILLKLDKPIEEIRTIMFALVSTDSMLFSLSLKDISKPIWKINLLNNKYLIFALITSIITFLITFFVPFLRKLLSISSITSADVTLVLSVGILDLVLIELIKYVYFERKNKV